MARPREFDPQEAVAAAKTIFWRQGFERTSVQDLVDGLGVGRGSIYAAFGDKHELFALALKSYVEHDQRDMLGALDGDGPVMPRVRRLLEAVLESAATDPGLGCFLVNSTTECAAHDPTTAQCATVAFEAMQRALSDALERAAEQGELRDDVDPAAAAALLVTTITGLQVVGKASPSSPLLRGALDAALAGLASPSR